MAVNGGSMERIHTSENRKKTLWHDFRTRRQFSRQDSYFELLHTDIHTNSSTIRSNVYLQRFPHVHIYCNNPSTHLRIEKKLFDMISELEDNFPAKTVILSFSIRIYIQTLRRFEVISICNVSLMFIYIATTPENFRTERMDGLMTCDFTSFSTGGWW